MKHLWEADHAYYCNEGNYYARERVDDEFKSWAEFIAAYADADFDLNLVFRFDWLEGEEHNAGKFDGDEHYRNGRLLIFWMGQRKGLYRWSEVSVCRADEPEVIKFLKPRFDYLMELWAPFNEPEPQAQSAAA